MTLTTTAQRASALVATVGLSGLFSACSHRPTPNLSDDSFKLSGRELYTVESYLEPQDGYEVIGTQLETGRARGKVRLTREDTDAVIEFIGGTDHKRRPFSAEHGDVNKLVAIVRTALSTLTTQHGNECGEPYLSRNAPIHIFFDTETARALARFERDTAPHTSLVNNGDGTVLSQATVARLFARLAQEGKLEGAGLSGCLAVAELRALAPLLQSVSDNTSSTPMRESLMRAYFER